MLRRHALSILLGTIGDLNARTFGSLDSILDPAHGAALLLNVASRKILATNSSVTIGGALYPPGSTLKPFVLAVLLKHGRLRADSSWACPRHLTVGNRQFDCVHPPLVTPMRIDTALAYSCNGFVAHAAEQFRPNELSTELLALGLGSRTGLVGEAETSGRIEPSDTFDAIRLQALGEASIRITPVELALAYRQLALTVRLPEMQPILAGLEGAVDFGTAQQARLPGTTVAGKTGSTRSSAGDSIAWFAGFMPSRAPEVVVTVMLSGHSGGSDAAPIAAQILDAHRKGRL